MNTKITVLVDNNSCTEGLIAEHGFSLYIESSKKILFDTGQGMALLHNARALHVDLDRIDYLVLSHGHYDHTGGVYALLQHARQNIPVYLHHDVFTHKIALDQTGERKGPERYIGIAHTREEYESYGAVFHFVHSYNVIDDRVSTFSDIEHSPGWVSNDARLQIKDEHGMMCPDPFRDDLSMLLETDSGPVIILGCAHAGIVEIVNTMSRMSGHKQFYAIIGGSHLAKASHAYLEQAVAMLHSYQFRIIALTHCTGSLVEEYLRQSFPEIFVPVSVGTQFTL